MFVNIERSKEQYTLLLVVEGSDEMRKGVNDLLDVVTGLTVAGQGSYVKRELN